MNVSDFLGMSRDDESTWHFNVADALITPGNFLFGGCGLAAGITALEEASGRPTIYAAAHYLSFAPLDAEVHVRVRLAEVGKRVTQARATAFVGDREILTVNAALGVGELTSTTPWVTMPSVPDPLDCPARVMPARFANTIFSHVETRIAIGRPMDQLDGTLGAPVSAQWTRVRSHLDMSAATLAIFGDLVSGGATQPLGRNTMGRSLDNTIRVASLVECEWVLCEIHMHALHNGFAQGTGFLWSQDGTLLGTASQSLSAKYWEPPAS